MYNLPFKVPGSQADRQLLHFYCSEAAGGLSSFSDSTLWSRLILQRSHDQPVVRHALVTLAALYRDYLQGGNTIQATASGTAMQRVAKCHRQLRLYLRSPDASPETALICSVLFYAFESLMGDCTSAMQHLNNGITLLKQYQTTQQVSGSSPGSSSGSSAGSPTSPPPTTDGAGDDLLPHLTSIFARLDIHASTFDDERIPILTLVSPDELSGAVHVVPTEFSGIDEAEGVLTKLQNWLMHHIIAHVAHKHKPLGEFPQSLLRERFLLYQQFDRFFFALNMLLSSLPTEIPPRALLLRIQSRMYHAILVENIPYEPQKGPFGYAAPEVMANDSLRTTLADIQAFLALERLEDSSQSFTLSSQLIAILYFLCLKTADPVNREAAFALLQNPRLPAKDGLWETGKAISIIRTLMEQTKANAAHKQSLERAGGDVFGEDVGGIENVYREISTAHTEPPDRGL